MAGPKNTVSSQRGRLSADLVEPSQNLARTIRSLFGARGEAWLEGLPNHLRDAAERWQLELAPPYPNLSYHYVAPATRADGTQCVVKLGVFHKEMATEIAALDVFAGRGSVRLLDAHIDEVRGTGALLLERLMPGDVLWSEPSLDVIARETADVMRGLWEAQRNEETTSEESNRSSGSRGSLSSQLERFPTVSDWGRGFQRLRAAFDGGTGPFSAQLVEAAERTYADLGHGSDRVRLLHGDLHPDNILRSGKESWLAIDPKGLVGEPAYEPGALLRNLPVDRSDGRASAERWNRAADIIAERLGLDAERILRWGVAQEVLSVWWSVEDGEWDAERVQSALADMDLIGPHLRTS